MSRFHKLSIKNIRRETPEAVSISLTVPDDLAAEFQFRPGQFLTLRRSAGTEEVRRCYSICAAPADGELRVGIKRVAGGAFSVPANDEFQVADEIEVMSPEGRFILPDNADGRARNLVAFASGSGITPILSMIRHTLVNEADTRITLFYGNRTTSSIMFHEELEDLKDSYLERFSLIHLLSRESLDVDLLHGRIDAERVAALAAARLFDPSTADAFLICGPGDMIEAVQGALIELGAEATSILTERFTPADGAPSASSRARTATPNGGHPETIVAARIETIVDGTRRTFDMTGDDGNVVDAARRAGLDLPHSCKGGMCCTCRCRVIEGDSEMAINYSLQQWELDAGFTLACQTRPRGEKLVLDFDAV